LSVGGECCEVGGDGAGFFFGIGCVKDFGHARGPIGGGIQNFGGDVVVIQARADSRETWGVEWAFGVIIIRSVALAALELLKEECAVVAGDGLRQFRGWIVGKGCVGNGNRDGAVFGGPEEAEGGGDGSVGRRGVTNEDLVRAFAEADGCAGVVRFGEGIGGTQDFFAVEKEGGLAGEFGGEGVLGA